MKDHNRRFLCFGLIMEDILLGGIQELPQNWEQTVSAAKIKESIGGGAANSAVTLGKLGCRVDIAGLIGRDDIGCRVKNELQSARVDVNILDETEEASTGTAVGLVRENGDRCFITVRGSNALFCGMHLEKARRKRYDFVHLNGFFQLPALESELPGLLKEWRERGSVISFDMASSDPEGRWFEAVRPFTDQIDYFFTNETQLKLLSKTDSREEGALFLQQAGAGSVIVKMGCRGCCSYARDGAVYRSDAIAVKAIDTTGAGDSFDAAYMFGVSMGWDPGKCGLFANVVAGLNCGRMGASAGVPDYETALAVMKGKVEKEKCHW